MSPGEKIQPNNSMSVVPSLSLACLRGSILSTNTAKVAFFEIRFHHSENPA